ncbi:type II secretion system protein GspE [candidate division Kazan bacterium]|uniref:Type II secretion system protein GspE n=1 Tax=candidate division Kazan bacterium TaxID=2202143 RepID=A0A420ZDA1_UNCK3|nr:MAG: type II secretion system protein GspE [candidate division Kazan bacterium]
MAQDKKTPNKKPSLDQVVSGLKRSKEEEITKKRAKGFQLEYRNLAGFQPDPTVVGVIPQELAKSAKIFAFDKRGTKIMLAITHPQNKTTLAALKKLSAEEKYKFVPVIVSDSSMKYLLSIYETFAPQSYKQPEVKITSSTQRELEIKVRSLSEFQKHLAKTPISSLLNVIFAGAAGINASDIHIEPTAKNIKLRYRLDGVLQEVATIPLKSLEPIISRIKLLANLKLNIKKTAQDGRLSITVGKDKYDIRVSILPTQYGESVVMRLLPQESKFITLDKLGLDATSQKLINEAIHQPNGLILNTGPTGSGKTTTLYAILNTINSPTKKIITVEDPIEYRLKGITQTQVDPEAGYDFPNALRSIVRQDPDIILVGEIRDQETANIAINASLTGHLVLSTLHANSAIGAIPRLIDLAARPKLFANALQIVVAQRLLRTVCPKCGKKYKPTPEEKRQIRKILPDAKIPEFLIRATGCEACNNTGFKGRVGIFEVLKVTPEIRELIIGKQSVRTIAKQAIAQGMVTMAQNGIDKVLKGQTTLKELFRIIANK